MKKAELSKAVNASSYGDDVGQIFGWCKSSGSGAGPGFADAEPSGFACSCKDPSGENRS